jgi:hypothetical protein
MQKDFIRECTHIFEMFTFYMYVHVVCVYEFMYVNTLHAQCLRPVLLQYSEKKKI